MPIKKSVLLLASTLGLAFAAKHLDHHKCTHDSHNNPEPQVYDFEADLPDEERSERILASTTTTPAVTYPNLRMKANYDWLSEMTTDFQSYVANDLIPPIMDYFSAALKVKSPIATTIKFSTSTTNVCGLATPDELKKGVATDFYWVIRGINEPDGDYVAQSYACFLDSKTKRPYAARTILNNGYMPVSSDDPVRHEKNMICVMHEVTHTLGFSSSLFKYFLDSNGKLQSNVVQSVTLDGESVFVITAEPIKTKLRNYFGCPNLEGAYMENDGGSGNAGSHFERRQFGFEAMTSGLIYEMQYSQFSLAMLESTGWYQIDYSYADPYFWGQGQGCNFLKQSCDASNFTFDEFCSGSARGCVNPGRGGGSCSDDSKSDGCKFYHPSINYDCENPDAADYARLPSLQAYGRGLGSKCFTGTLTTSKSASQTSFCFKNTCSGSGTNTTVTLTVGTTQVKCTKEGTVTVKGYNGVINCPDPLTFCSTVGQKVCPRGCMGRGKCVDGVCLCNSGFKGTDCALSV